MNIQILCPRYALGSYVLGAAVLAATISGCSAQTLQTSVTKDGITWTFDRQVPVGQFVNGDYYVVGPVNVTAISPPPTTASPYTNGSVINLPSSNGKSGFDERLNDGADQSSWFDATLRAYPPFALKPGDALVSSISVGQIHSLPEVMRSTDVSISPVRTVSVLTVLSSAVTADAFRPSYCDRSQAIRYAHNLQTQLLPSLARPNPAGTPTLAQFETWFRRPWIDTNRFLFDAPGEYMPSYSQYVAFAGSYAALLLTLDFPASQKVTLTNYFVQYGIDLFGCLDAGFSGWAAFGGHGSGRKLPIIFAGTLLNDSRMKQVSSLYPDKFGEDMQTMYVSQTPPAGTYSTAWQGATAVYAGHYGIQTNGQVVSAGLYGPYEHLQPRNWPVDSGGGLLGEVYRRCCTSNSWPGEALAIELLGAKSSWNYPAFFDYADRWMSEDDTQAVLDIKTQTGTDYSSNWLRQKQTQYMLQGGFPQNTFIDDMWQAYRSYQPPPPPPPPDTTPPSVPGGLSASVISSSQINLSWSPSTDNVGVAGYRVYRGGAQIATAAATSYSNTGLSAATSYTYTVAAYDAAGNVSGQSTAVTATTQGSSGTGASPSAAYGFEAQSGTTVVDSSGNGNAGSMTNGSWVAGKYGQAVSFAGTGFVSIPDAASLKITGPGSIEAWVKPTTLGIWQSMIAKGNQNSDAGQNYAIEITPANKAVCVIGNGTTGSSSVTSVTAFAAQFTHVACTWDGTTMKLYVNGALDASAPQTVLPAGNTSPLLFGKYGGNVDYAKGVIDEVRVYNTALTQAQVQSDLQTRIVAPLPDTTPPSVPGGLSASVISSSQINLSWSPSSDNVGVAGYRVYRGGAQIGTATATSYSNTGLSPATSYTYTVAAYDAANNVSGQSTAVTATTQGSSGTGTSPSAAYGFEAQSGTTVVDSSGNGNTGSMTNGSWVAGKYGQAVSFAGTGFVSIPDAVSLKITGPGSIEAWVKPTTLGIWQSIIAKGNQNSDAGQNYAIEITPANQAVCVIGNGANGSSSVTSVTAFAAQFTHVACTWDGTTMKLYVNGALDASAPQTVLPAGNTSPLLFGKYGGNVDYAKGVIDEVRVYNTALTQAQVQSDLQTRIN